MRSLFIAAACSLIASLSNAQTYNSGFGTSSCSRFLQDIVHTETQIVAFSWAQGFVAGINIASISDRKKYYDVSGLTGMEALKRVTNFCRRNPDKPFIAAADALLLTLPKTDWRGD